MPAMPSLSPPDRRHPARAFLSFAAFAGVAAAGVWTIQACHRQKAQAATPPDAGVIQAEAPKPPPATPEDQLAKSGLRRISVTINGPLETSIVESVGPTLGAPLTQVLTRSLVWWVEVPGEILRGDKIDALFEERAGQEPVVHAIRFTSGKMGKTFAAYRFKAAKDTFARFYQPDGSELELRLKDAPLEDYEQVTSHLRDGRHHKGIDFKTPVGSPVHATFAGTITRKTWNFRGNGNSLEVADGTGRHAMYLHLSPVAKTIKPGDHVAKGQVIAESGNTGHSFAPHLHYQLMQGEKLLDPFKVDATYRRSLPEDQKAAFDAEVRHLNELIDLPVAAK